MKHMTAIERITEFLVQDDGATAIEYAVMLALILSALVGAARLTGCSALRAFGRTAMALR